MEFQFLDIEELSEEEILDILRHNHEVCVAKQFEIDRLKKGMYSFVSRENTPVVIKNSEIDDKKSENVRDDDFEEEIDYYLSDLLALGDNDLKQNIEDILPSRSNGNYSKIVLRLISEMQREINEINEVIFGEQIDEEELQDFKNEISLFEKKKEVLKESLIIEELDQEQKSELKKRNRLIFIPTNYGNPRVFEELKDIPQEYYSNFLELVESIKDGSFKGVKRFTNNVTLKGACEVRGFSTRIIFIRLSHDCFGLLTAFLKKTKNGKGYRKQLELKMTEFNKIKDSIIEKLDDEEFLLENEEIERDLYFLLGQGKEEVFSNDTPRTSR